MVSRMEFSEKSVWQFPAQTRIAFTRSSRRRKAGFTAPMTRASISTDGAKTWTTQNNQPTAQFYHVAVDNAFPYHIYGAQQDNSNVGLASRTDSGTIGREDWFQAGGGECGFVVPDPRDWHIIY